MTNDTRINYDKIYDFEEYMNRKSTETRDFLRDINRNSRNQSAIATSRKINNAEKRIRTVDPSHIPPEKYTHVTGKQCGANISKKATINKNKNNRKYKASNLKAVLLTLALATSAAMSIHAITDNNKTETNLGVTSDTKALLDNIAQLIETNKLGIDNSSDIRTALDDVIDVVMTDLATSAIEASGDKKVVSVETRYDKSVNQYVSSAAEPHPENFCNVTYLDENNNNKTITICSFDSDINKLYDFEYQLDYKDDLSISDYEKMYNHINNIAENKKAKYSTFYDKHLSTKKLSKSEKEQKENLENDKTDIYR